MTKTVAYSSPAVGAPVFTGLAAVRSHTGCKKLNSSSKPNITCLGRGWGGLAVSGVTSLFFKDRHYIGIEKKHFVGLAPLSFGSGVN